MILTFEDRNYNAKLQTSKTL